MYLLYIYLNISYIFPLETGVICRHAQQGAGTVCVCSITLLNAPKNKMNLIQFLLLFLYSVFVFFLCSIKQSFCRTFGHQDISVVYAQKLGLFLKRISDSESDR